MIYDISKLEQSPHVSPDGKLLYWLDKEKGILTDGYRLYDYDLDTGLMERHYAKIPTNHIKVTFELIELTLNYINQNPDSTIDDLLSVLINAGMSEDSAQQWISLFQDAVAEFVLKTTYDDCKQWVINQLQNKTTERVAEMLVGMLAFTDVFPHANIVIYKNNMPYKQVVTL